ncbi:hypothetical protein VTO73DRAFT_14972 [Trametes versicolor]
MSARGRAPALRGAVCSRLGGPGRTSHRPAVPSSARRRRLELGEWLGFCGWMGGFQQSIKRASTAPLCSLPRDEHVPPR